MAELFVGRKNGVARRSCVINHRVHHRERAARVVCRAVGRAARVVCRAVERGAYGGEK